VVADAQDASDQTSKSTGGRFSHRFPNGLLEFFNALIKRGGNGQQ
jgi:hypothetical protein